MKFIAPFNPEKASEVLLGCPPSKSLTQRALGIALLANGESEILNPSLCDDAISALKIITSLGAKVDAAHGNFKIYPGKQNENITVDCGESGFNIRFFAPIAALFNSIVTLEANGSLNTRPVEMLEVPLKVLGAKCKTSNGYPPIEVQGPLRGGEIEIDCAITSQFLSGLLVTLPLCTNDSTIKVKNLVSKPYIALTISLIRFFGGEIEVKEDFLEFFIKGGQKYSGRSFIVEGDWSGAAFLAVAGALCGGVTITGVLNSSLQGDKVIVNVLRDAGAKVSFLGNACIVENHNLIPFDFDATDTPDLIPPLVSLAANCTGKSAISGSKRLLNKESSRAVALIEEFAKLGVKIEEVNNVLYVHGGVVYGGEINSHNDHRIAMACAVAALRSQKGVKINGDECVSKSYPNFFNDIKAFSDIG